jgi:hypothetical protein
VMVCAMCNDRRAVCVMYVSAERLLGVYACVVYREWVWRCGIKKSGCDDVYGVEKSG